MIVGPEGAGDEEGVGDAEAEGDADDDDEELGDGLADFEGVGLAWARTTTEPNDGPVRIRTAMSADNRLKEIRASLRELPVALPPTSTFTYTS